MKPNNMWKIGNQLGSIYDRMLVGFIHEYLKK